MIVPVALLAATVSSPLSSGIGGRALRGTGARKHRSLDVWGEGGKHEARGGGSYMTGSPRILARAASR